MATAPTNATKSVVFANPPGSKNYVKAEVPLQAMNDDLMDTAFTKAVGCDEFPGGCEGMMQHYRFTKTVPLSEHWKHKYLVDFDGMGYSARAMAFLASESVMVKSTVYREFFSDWIQPWYVLIMHDLPFTLVRSDASKGCITYHCHNHTRRYTISTPFSRDPLHPCSTQSSRVQLQGAHVYHRRTTATNYYK